MTKNKQLAPENYRHRNVSEPEPDRERTGGGKRKRARKDNFRRDLILILISFFILFIVYIVVLEPTLSDYRYMVHEYEIYLPAGWDQWEGIDYTMAGDNILLSREKYMAPNLELEIGDLLQRHSNAVFRNTGRLGGHTGGAYTVFAVRTTAGDMLAVAVDRQGQLALVSDPMAAPEFSESRVLFGASKLEGEYELLLLIDRGTTNCELYLNGTKVLEEQWPGAENPVTKLWIGSIWIGGGANYGAPIDHEVYEFTVGSK